MKRILLLVVALAALAFTATASAQSISNYQTRMKACAETIPGAVRNNVSTVYLVTKGGSFGELENFIRTFGQSIIGTIGGGGQAFFFHSDGYNEVDWEWVQNANGTLYTGGLAAHQLNSSYASRPTASEWNSMRSCLHASEDNPPPFFDDYYASDGNVQTR